MEEMRGNSNQNDYGSNSPERPVEMAASNGHEGKELAPEVVFTEGEQRVLEAYRRLKSSGRVADELDMRDDTVKSVLVTCRDKLGLSTIKELAGPKSVASSVTSTSLMTTLVRQDYRCAISGVPITPQTAALDHKVSIADGGEHEIDNVWFVHRDVNAAKGSMSLSAFVEMCARVAKCHGDRPV
jgi:hypothetical protein